MILNKITRKRKTILIVSSAIIYSSILVSVESQANLIAKIEATNTIEFAKINLTTNVPDKAMGINVENLRVGNPIKVCITVIADGTAPNYELNFIRPAVESEVVNENNLANNIYTTINRYENIANNSVGLQCENLNNPKITKSKVFLEKKSLTTLHSDKNNPYKLKNHTNKELVYEILHTLEHDDFKKNIYKKSNHIKSSIQFQLVLRK